MFPSDSPRVSRNVLRAGFALLAAFLLYLCALSANAQSFTSTTGLMQGERIARVSTVFNGTLKASSDTTGWVAFGTHLAGLATERAFAPTRFTLFVKLDTAGVAHAHDPSVTLSAQLALDDTSIAYDQSDGSLSLFPTTDPLTQVSPGSSVPVPIYGGGWVRFIVAAEDTVDVKLDLWRVR